MTSEKHYKITVDRTELGHVKARESCKYLKLPILYYIFRNMQLILCRHGKAIFDYGNSILDIKDIPLLFSLYHSNKINIIAGDKTSIYFNEIDEILYISTQPVFKLSIIIHKYCIGLYRSFPNQLSDTLGTASTYLQQLRLFSNLNGYLVLHSKSMHASIKYYSPNLLANLIFTDNKLGFATLRAWYKRQSFLLEVSDIFIIQIILSRKPEGYTWIPIQLDKLVFLLIKKEDNNYFVHVSDRHDKFDDIMKIHFKCLQSLSVEPRLTSFKLEYAYYGLFIHNNQVIALKNEKLLKLKYQKYNLKDPQYTYDQFIAFFQTHVATKLILRVQEYINSKDRPLETCQIISMVDGNRYCCTGWHHGDSLYLISSEEKAEYMEREKDSILKQIGLKEDIFIN